ncbi:hypothetical protein J6590_025730 [Homalodisca vitripennis]|nr:hypothetical protein J6590_025730 [Homalodisca vitripennis]
MRRESGHNLRHVTLEEAPSETYDSRRREVASAVTAIASHLRPLLRNRPLFLGLTREQLSTRLVTVLFGDFAYCYCQYIIVYRVVCVTGKCLGYSFVMENVGKAAISRMSESSGFPPSAATADRHAYFRCRQLVMIFKTRKYNKATHSTDTSARKYKNAAHQLNGRRESVVTLSTRSLDFDLCLRMGREEPGHLVEAMGPIPEPGSELFKDCVFLVTYTNQVEIRAVESSYSGDESGLPVWKERLRTQIKNGGGKVSKDELERTYLVTDKPSNTPLYLQCLVNNIPIYSIAVIKQCCTQNICWKDVISQRSTKKLSAGYSLAKKCMVNPRSTQPLRGKTILIALSGDPSLTAFWENLATKVGGACETYRGGCLQRDKFDMVVTDPGCDQDLVAQACEQKLPLVSVMWLQQCIDLVERRVSRNCPGLCVMWLQRVYYIDLMCCVTVQRDKFDMVVTDPGVIRTWWHRLWSRTAPVSVMWLQQCIRDKFDMVVTDPGCDQDLVAQACEQKLPLVSVMWLQQCIRDKFDMVVTDPGCDQDLVAQACEQKLPLVSVMWLQQCIRDKFDMVVTDPGCDQDLVAQACEQKLPLVSVMWLQQCIVTGECRSPTESPLYKYNSEEGQDSPEY